MGLSRNKVAVPEGAAGTPPFWSLFKIVIRMLYVVFLFIRFVVLFPVFQVVVVYYIVYDTD